MMFQAEKVSRLSSFKTPFYFYDLDLLRKTLESIMNEATGYGYHVHYALKANANDRIIDIIRTAALGADCVSGNEVKKAVERGFKSDQIVFAGVGKSDEEILYALENDIHSFNCESFQELEVINNLATSINKKARVALRINPNVNANTHKYITTGLEENKFGINLWELEAVTEGLKNLPAIELVGIHFHIGSQITDLESFKSLCLRVNEIQEWFANRRIIIENVNVGGGLGVDYHNPDGKPLADFKEYFQLFKKFLELRQGQKVHFELGRAVVAQCGSLITKVLYIKKGITTNFAILDAGMTELIRPALYQSYHKIENLSQLSKRADFRYDVVGPICESSDCFGKAVSLPESNRGDLFAIRTAGAYGEVMSSGYNLRERVAAVYSDDL